MIARDRNGKIDWHEIQRPFVMFYPLIFGLLFTGIALVVQAVNVRLLPALAVLTVGLAVAAWVVAIRKLRNS